MQGYKLVAVNTIAQYVRTVINIVLSLITVRLILGTLGPSDYGIYSLIAGVTAMLAFFLTLSRFRNCPTNLPYRYL